MNNKLLHGLLFDWEAKAFPGPKPLTVAEALCQQRDISPTAISGEEREEDDVLFEHALGVISWVRERLPKGSRVFINSDYDVDGLVSSFILEKIFKALGAQVELFVPNRFSDSYGVNLKRIEKALTENCVNLVVCADCGATKLDDLGSLAKSYGCYVLVIDHHLRRLPLQTIERVIELNPHAIDGAMPEQYCAGLLSVLLAIGLAKEYSDFAAALHELRVLGGLAVIADVISVRGAASRAAARFCLRNALSASSNLGLRALVHARCGTLKVLTSSDFGFRVCPILNAAGRLDSAERALSILKAESESEAHEKIRCLIELNRRRQRLQAEIERLALAAYDQESGLLIAYGRWHHGVVGPAAGSLSERLGIPVILGGPDASRKSFAFSGRSRSNVDLNRELALATCDLPVQFGGHQAAIGMRVPAAAVEEVVKTLRIKMIHLPKRQSRARRVYDIGLRPQNVSRETWNSISRLEPFGPGNEEPVFFVPSVKLKLSASSKRPGDGFGVAGFRDFTGRVERFPVAVYNRPELLGCRIENAHLIGNLMLDAYGGETFVRLKVLDVIP